MISAYDDDGGGNDDDYDDAIGTEPAGSHMGTHYKCARRHQTAT